MKTFENRISTKHTTILKNLVQHPS